MHVCIGKLHCVQQRMFSLRSDFFFFVVVVDRLDNVSERYLVLHHTGATAFGMSGYMI